MTEYYGKIDVSFLSREEAALIQKVIQRHKRLLDRDEERIRMLHDMDGRDRLQKTGGWFQKIQEPQHGSECRCNIRANLQPSFYNKDNASEKKNSGEIKGIKADKNNADTQALPGSSLQSRITAFFTFRNKSAVQRGARERKLYAVKGREQLQKTGQGFQKIQGPLHGSGCKCNIMANSQLLSKNKVMTPKKSGDIKAFQVVKENTDTRAVPTSSILRTWDTALTFRKKNAIELGTKEYSGSNLGGSSPPENLSKVLSKITEGGDEQLIQLSSIAAVNARSTPGESRIGHASSSDVLEVRFDRIVVEGENFTDVSVCQPTSQSTENFGDPGISNFQMELLSDDHIALNIKQATRNSAVMDPRREAIGTLISQEYELMPKDPTRKSTATNSVPESVVTLIDRPGGSTVTDSLTEFVVAPVDPLRGPTVMRSLTESAVTFVDPLRESKVTDSFRKLEFTLSDPQRDSADTGSLTGSLVTQNDAIRESTVIDSLTESEIRISDAERESLVANSLTEFRITLPDIPRESAVPDSMSERVVTFIDPIRELTACNLPNQTTGLLGDPQKGATYKNLLPKSIVTLTDSPRESRVTNSLVESVITLNDRESAVSDSLTESVVIFNDPTRDSAVTDSLTGSIVTPAYPPRGPRVTLTESVVPRGAIIADSMMEPVDTDGEPSRMSAVINSQITSPTDQLKQSAVTDSPVDSVITFDDPPRDSLVSDSIIESVVSLNELARDAIVIDSLTECSVKLSDPSTGPTVTDSLREPQIALKDSVRLSNVTESTVTQCDPLREFVDNNPLRESVFTLCDPQTQPTVTDSCSDPYREIQAEHSLTESTVTQRDSLRMSNITESQSKSIVSPHISLRKPKLIDAEKEYVGTRTEPCAEITLIESVDMLSHPLRKITVSEPLKESDVSFRDPMRESKLANSLAKNQDMLIDPLREVTGTDSPKETILTLRDPHTVSTSMNSLTESLIHKNVQRVSTVTPSPTESENHALHESCTEKSITNLLAATLDDSMRECNIPDSLIEHPAPLVDSLSEWTITDSQRQSLGMLNDPRKQISLGDSLLKSVDKLNDSFREITVSNSQKASALSVNDFIMESKFSDSLTEDPDMLVDSCGEVILTYSLTENTGTPSAAQRDSNVTGSGTKYVEMVNDQCTEVKLTNSLLKCVATLSESRNTDSLADPKVTFNDSLRKSGVSDSLAESAEAYSDQFQENLFMKIQKQYENLLCDSLTESVDGPCMECAATDSLKKSEITHSDLNGDGTITSLSSESVVAQTDPYCESTLSDLSTESVVIVNYPLSELRDTVSLTESAAMLHDSPRLCKNTDSLSESLGTQIGNATFDPQAASADEFYDSLNKPTIGDSLIGSVVTQSDSLSESLIPDSLIESVVMVNDSVGDTFAAASLKESVDVSDSLIKPTILDSMTKSADMVHDSLRSCKVTDFLSESVGTLKQWQGLSTSDSRTKSENTFYDSLRKPVIVNSLTESIVPHNDSLRESTVLNAPTDSKLTGSHKDEVTDPLKQFILFDNVMEPVRAITPLRESTFTDFFKELPVTDQLNESGFKDPQKTFTNLQRKLTITESWTESTLYDETYTANDSLRQYVVTGPVDAFTNADLGKKCYVKVIDSLNENTLTGNDLPTELSVTSESLETRVSDILRKPRDIDLVRESSPLRESKFTQTLKKALLIDPLCQSTLIDIDRFEESVAADPVSGNILSNTPSIPKYSDQLRGNCICNSQMKSTVQDSLTNQIRECTYNNRKGKSVTNILITKHYANRGVTRGESRLCERLKDSSPSMTPSAILLIHRRLRTKRKMDTHISQPFSPTYFSPPFSIRSPLVAPEQLTVYRRSFADPFPHRGTANISTSKVPKQMAFLNS